MVGTGEGQQRGIEVWGRMVRLGPFVGKDLKLREEHSDRACGRVRAHPVLGAPSDCRREMMGEGMEILGVEALQAI